MGSEMVAAISLLLFAAELNGSAGQQEYKQDSR
jgi:hypothetical protein